MSSVSGYAKIIATARARSDAHKPLLGKATLKYGQCFALAGYLLQLGSMLGSLHRAKIDAFGLAFLGLTGEPGAMDRFLDEAKGDVLELASQGGTFSDFVAVEQGRRFNVNGTMAELLTQHGLQKVEVPMAIELAWQFAEMGTILGAAFPDRARAMFEATYARNPESWARAHSAGVDIPQTPDVMSWDALLKEENEGFMQYCEQCAPDLYTALK